MEQITPSILGFDTFTDGDGMLFTLFSEQTDDSQVDPGIVLDTNQRSWEWWDKISACRSSTDNHPCQSRTVSAPGYEKPARGDVLHKRRRNAHQPTPEITVDAWQQCNVGGGWDYSWSRDAPFDTSATFDPTKVRVTHRPHDKS